MNNIIFVFVLINFYSCSGLQPKVSKRMTKFISERLNIDVLRKLSNRTKERKLGSIKELANFIDSLGFEQISIGDYVLTGGEVAAQVLVEGCVRLLPEVLGHSKSILEESFSENLLEYPQYTRPKVWVDKKGEEHHVPDILVSGHHEKIKKWRQNKSVELTKRFRPDLLKKSKKAKN